MARLKWVAVGAAGVLLLFAIFATIWGWWPTVLDIVLVLTALTSAVMLGALIFAVLYLTRTLREIKAELTPVLDSLRATSTAVRETAKTASSLGVQPAVRTASLVVGAGEFASIVLGRGQVRKRSEQRRKRRVEIEREMAQRSDLDGAR